MKKWLLLYLVFSVLASSLPGSWLMLPVELACLYEHYRYHQEEEGEDYSFVDFWVAHYSAAHYAEDPTHHKGLPFHQHHDQVTLTPQVPFLLPQPHGIVLAAVPDHGTGILISSSQFWSPKLLEGDIWQPPKA